MDETQPMEGVFMYGQIDDTVNIPQNEYEELLERSERLAVLEIIINTPQSELY